MDSNTRYAAAATPYYCSGATHIENANRSVQRLEAFKQHCDTCARMSDLLDMQPLALLDICSSLPLSAFAFFLHKGANVHIFDISEPHGKQGHTET